MEPRLHNAREMSRCCQLRNAHKDVYVRRVTANKSEYCDPNHFNIYKFRNHEPFSLFGFTFM